MCINLSDTCFISFTMIPKSLISLILVLNSFCFQNAAAYKVLGVFPFASPSHFFMGNQLMKGIAEHGHDVTMLTVYEEHNLPKNGSYRQIILNEAREAQTIMIQEVTQLDDKKLKTPLTALKMFNRFGSVVSESTLSDPKTQELLKSKEKFDCVIVPQFTFEALKAIAAHFDTHLIVFSIFPANTFLNHFVGNPSLPSIQTEMLLGYVHQMSFFQRCLNTLFSVAFYLNRQFVLYPDQADLVHKYISKDLDLYKIQYNMSLFLMNAHTSINTATSLVPNMVDIGGFHIKPPKELPDDLKKIFDRSQHGVILFSMGTNMRSENFPKQLKEDLFKAFSKRNETVLWKLEENILIGKPPNVVIRPRFPQSDVLAHPKTKLFITHGGFLSTIETIYHGVPAVAIPVVGDQILNSRLLEDMGMSTTLNFAKLNEELISAAIEKVLSNKIYAKNAKHRQAIYHDRPRKPINEAVYWMEYVIRHRGARHLRVNYLDLYWFQFYLLDVYAFYFAIIFSIYFLIKLTINKYCRRIKVRGREKEE